MTSSCVDQKRVFRVPDVGFQRKHGISIDFGGSVVKIIHASPSGEDGFLDFHCCTFSRNDFDSALEYLDTQTRDRLALGGTVYTTGIGCSQYKERIDSTLKVDTKVLTELQCIVDGLLYLLSNFPERDLVYPTADTVTDHVNTFIQELMSFLPELKEQAENMTPWDVMKDNDDTEKDAKDNTNLSNGHGEDTDLNKIEYPIILMMAGSGGAPLTIHQNGKYECSDLNPLCGKSFLGLGRLLTGAKSFDELLELASRGDKEALHTTGRQMKAESGGSDFYKAISDTMILYAFGNCQDKDLADFRKEDVAAAVLETVAQDVAQQFHTWSMLLDAKKVYFSGGLIDGSETIRNEIDKNFTLRVNVNAVGKRTSHAFLNQGIYLGGIGALLKNLQEDSENTST